MFIEVIPELEVEPDGVLDLRGGAAVEPKIFCQGELWSQHNFPPLLA